MTSVPDRIIAFYEQMAATADANDRQAIKYARQLYYDQLPDADKVIAREAARPYLQKLAYDIGHDPSLAQLDAFLNRIGIPIHAA